MQFLIFIQKSMPWWIFIQTYQYNLQLDEETEYYQNPRSYLGCTFQAFPAKGNQYSWILTPQIGSAVLECHIHRMMWYVLSVCGFFHSVISLWYLQMLLYAVVVSSRCGPPLRICIYCPFFTHSTFGLLIVFGDDKHNVKNILCVSLGYIPSTGTPKHRVPLYSAFPDPARCFLKQLCKSAPPQSCPPQQTTVQLLHTFVHVCYDLSAFLIWGRSDITLWFYSALHDDSCLENLPCLFGYPSVMACSNICSFPSGLSAFFLLLCRSSLHLLDRSLVCEL